MNIMSLFVSESEIFLEVSERNLKAENIARDYSQSF